MSWDDAVDGVELSRKSLQLTKKIIEQVVASPDARSEGFGQVKLPRLSLMASQVGDAYKTKTRINPTAVWNGNMLPDATALNVLRLLPPLTITKAEIDEYGVALKQSLQTLISKGVPKG